MGRIRDERNRHPSLGYTREHDQKAGTGHLLYWGCVYLLRGKMVKGFSLFLAAIEARRPERRDSTPPTPGRPEVDQVFK